MGFDFGLDIKNIGPLVEARIPATAFSSNETAIYAPNGSGKSFISKTFQLLSENGIDNPNKLINFDADEARLKMEISSKDGPISSSINLDRKSSPKIVNSYYIFHVFNSHYVEHSIKPTKFRPKKKEEISGYILGKLAVDLSDKEDELKKIKEIYENYLETQALPFRNNQLASWQSEFKGITQYPKFNELKNKNISDYNKEGYLEQKYNQKKEDVKKLDNIPDDLKEAFYILITFNLDTDNISSLLTLSIPKFEVSKETKLFLTEHRAFIESGLKIPHKEKCPFCDQPLTHSGLSQIELYENFISSTEAETQKKIDVKISELNIQKEKIESIKQDIEKMQNSFNKLKSSLVDVKEELPIMPEGTIEHLSTLCQSFINHLLEKKNDLSISIACDSDIKILQESEKTILLYNNLAEKAIEQINKRFKKISAERQAHKRELIDCFEGYLANSKELVELNRLYNLFSEKQKELHEQQRSVKKEKSEEFYNTLNNSLKFFFKDKYILDGDFIGFKGKKLEDNTEDVLSDGEKQIMAFCYYLAEKHLLIEKEDDYNRLFFIIDDPISSLDENYIYCMIQILKKLKLYFQKKEAKFKYIILTHNSIFMSMLIRNKISQNNFEIKNNDFIKIGNDKFRLPYRSHLQDIYDIARNKKSPTHTTANSIRQILESLNSFICPEKELQPFIAGEDLLKDTEIYTFCQDASHADLFCESLTDTEIIHLCEVVIRYIEKSLFKQQLKCCL